MVEVTVLPGGERFRCADGESLLDAGHAADILLPYSCRGGRCGSCQMRLVSGEVDYPRGRPEALDGLAEDQVLMCSARALTNLVVELLPPKFD